MRTPFVSSVLAVVLAGSLLSALSLGLASGCKKENKQAAAVSAAETALQAAGRATEAAGVAAGKATEAAGEAAEAAGETAEAAAEAAAAAAASAMTPDGEPGPRPPSVTEADVAVMEKTVALLDKVGQSVNGVGNDCKKLAAALKSVSGEAETMMREGKQVIERHGGDEGALLWINQSYAKRMMPVVVKINGHPCASDSDVQAALAPFAF